jgi:hypothetical protein
VKKQVPDIKEIPLLMATLTAAINAHQHHLDGIGTDEFTDERHEQLCEMVREAAVPVLAFTTWWCVNRSGDPVEGFLQLFHELHTTYEMED